MTIGSQIDLLLIFGRFGREKQISLRDPKAMEQFLYLIKEDMTSALQNEALLHGQRTQNMFEALIVSLGEYKLLKTEDIGRIHPKGNYIAPDFRLILRDGRQWLVEVKNIFLKNPQNQCLSFKKDYIDKLISYADTARCPLKFALFWARWGIWTLIDKDDLIQIGKKFSISMLDAMRLNELGEIGDQIIGTKPPLALRLIADPNKERTITSDDKVKFTIGEVKLRCANNDIKNSVELDLSWIFMQYGDWKCSGPYAIISDNVLEAIEFEWMPRERLNDCQDFEMIGTLSSMFSRYYAEQTFGSEELTQIEAEFVPDWFSPLLDNSHKSEMLPLWRFVIQRGRDARET